MNNLQLTYIGGSTALLELGGLRLLTDPTFDPAGQEYKLPLYSLRKTMGPAIAPDRVGPVDIVLLSHDHHFDNLDHAGRAMLNGVGRILTTGAGAERLGQNALGLAPWQSFDAPVPNGRILRIIGTPARHGPPDGDRGPVVGFALFFADNPADVLYISGDTVWYEGLAEIANRFYVTGAVLFMGAARVPEVGPFHLTLTADEGVQVASVFANATIVPVHFEGWAHYSESRPEIMRAFARAALSHRLRWLEQGIPWQLLIKLS
jgi:L-ascorbate metabolism protein UlaG (beta-lactamase superfamily)